MDENATHLGIYIYVHFGCAAHREGTAATHDCLHIFLARPRRALDAEHGRIIAGRIGLGGALLRIQPSGAARLAWRTGQAVGDS